MPALRKASSSRALRKLPYQPAEISTSTQLPIINIVDHGDVILLYGKERQGLRASSQMLRAPCKVFDRMFSLDFAEGQNLSKSQPKKVPFPEDNARAMEIICEGINLNNNKVPGMLEPDELVKLARIIDKYELHRALHLAVDRWLLPYLKPITDCRLPAAYLVVAQPLNHGKAFRYITDKLIFRSRIDFQTIAEQYPEETSNLWPALCTYAHVLWGTRVRDWPHTDQMERLRSVFDEQIRARINKGAHGHNEGNALHYCGDCGWPKNLMGIECRSVQTELTRPDAGIATINEIYKYVHQIPHMHPHMAVRYAKCHSVFGCTEHEEADMRDMTMSDLIVALIDLPS